MSQGFSVFTTFKAKDSFSPALNKMSQGAERFGSKMNSMMSGIKAGFKNLSILQLPSFITSASQIIGGVVEKIKALISSSIELNKIMSTTFTSMASGEKVLLSYKKSVQGISQQYGKGTIEIANSLGNIVGAMGETKDTIKILDITTRSSVAGAAEAADTFSLLAAVTKGYGDTTEAAFKKVSDLAFKAVDVGDTSFAQLAPVVGSVVPAAKALGVMQEEIFAIFGTLTGVTGNTNEVATQIAAIETSFMKPTKEMSEALQNLGYDSGFAAVKQKGLVGTLNMLKKQTRGRQDLFVQLFGRKEAITSALALTNAQAGIFKDNLGEMYKASGATETAFEKQTTGLNALSFALGKLTAKFEVYGQIIGDFLAPYIIEAVAGLEKFEKGIMTTFGWLTDHKDEILAFLTGFFVAWSIINFGTMSFQLHMFGIMLTRELIPALIKTTAATWANTAAFLASPITWIALGIGLVVAALVWLVRNWDKATEAVKKWANWMSESTFGKILGYIFPIVGVLAMIVRNWDEIVAALGRFWEATKSVFGQFKDYIQNNFVDVLLNAMGPIGLIVRGVMKIGEAMGLIKGGEVAGGDFSTPAGTAPYSTPKANNVINARYNQSSGGLFGGRIEVVSKLENNTSFPATSSVNLMGNNGLTLAPAR